MSWRSKLEALGVSITAPKEEARKRRQAGGRLPYREFVSSRCVELCWSAAAQPTTTVSPFASHGRTICGCTLAVSQAPTSSFSLPEGKSCSPETYSSTQRRWQRTSATFAARNDRRRALHTATVRAQTQRQPRWLGDAWKRKSDRGAASKRGRLERLLGSEKQK